ncbi:MAG: methyltransferase domain-containing protein [Candidatus Micrarchaeota archaeon]
MLKKPDFHFPQIFRKLKRGPAIIQPKDAGMFIAYTGLNKDSVVAELGTGSGFMTIYLAQIAKHVTTYEMRDEFFQIAKSNVQKVGLDNVDCKLRNVLEQWIDEKELDLIFCDIKEPEVAIEKMHASLKEGGYVAAHCLNIEQAKAFHLACETKKFKEVFTLENIIREYAVRDFGIRPAHMGLLHTAYLVFARK